MSAYKDGNKFAENMVEGEECYAASAHDLAPKVPKSRAGKALFEGACVEDAEREAEYEKYWKEGQKV